MYNHNLMVGLNRHIIYKNHDLYFGLQPGISITKTVFAEIIKTDGVGVNPVLSPIVGYNYYVYKYFHLFVQSRLILGTHLHGSVQPLHELRVSAGLGLNLNLLNK